MIWYVEDFDGVGVSCPSLLDVFSLSWCWGTSRGWGRAGPTYILGVTDTSCDEARGVVDVFFYATLALLVGSCQALNRFNF